MAKDIFISKKRFHDSASKHVSGLANYTDDIIEPNGELCMEPLDGAKKLML